MRSRFPRYLIDCAMEAVALIEKGMDMDALPAGAEGLVLDAAQQQALLDGVSDLAGRLPGGRQIAEQAAMAAFASHRAPSPAPDYSGLASAGIIRFMPRGGFQPNPATGGRETVP